MTLPQLPTLPQKRPTTQPEWEAFVIQMQTWQQIFAPLLQLLDTSPATSATTGTAGTLPAKPSAYLVTTINGVTYKIPGYAP